MIKLVAILCLIAAIGCRENSPPAPLPQAPTRQVIAFTAEWCAPCRKNKPAITELELQGARIVHVNIDTHKIMATPKATNL